MISVANSPFKVHQTQSKKSTLASQFTDQNVSVLYVGVTGPLDGVYSGVRMSRCVLLNAVFEGTDTV